MASDMADSKKPSSPFAALEALRSSLPPGSPPEAEEVGGAEPPNPFRGKLVVSRRRKARAGKTVTVLAGIAAPADALEAMAKELRKALGAGASVEGELIVLQGDQLERVRAWLLARGASKITVGS